MLNHIHSQLSNSYGRTARFGISRAWTQTHWLCQRCSALADIHISKKKKKKNHKQLISGEFLWDAGIGVGGGGGTAVRRGWRWLTWPTSAAELAPHIPTGSCNRKTWCLSDYRPEWPVTMGGKESEFHSWGVWGSHDSAEVWTTLLMFTGNLWDALIYYNSGLCLIL